MTPAEVVTPSPAIACDVAAFNDAAINMRTEPRTQDQLLESLKGYPWVGQYAPELFHKRYAKLFRFYLADDDAQQYARERRAKLAALAR